MIKISNDYSQPILKSTTRSRLLRLLWFYIRNCVMTSWRHDSWGEDSLGSWGSRQAENSISLPMAVSFTPDYNKSASPFAGTQSGSQLPPLPLLCPGHWLLAEDRLESAVLPRHSLLRNPSSLSDKDKCGRCTKGKQWTPKKTLQEIYLFVFIFLFSAFSSYSFY